MTNNLDAVIQRRMNFQVISIMQKRYGNMKERTNVVLFFAKIMYLKSDSLKLHCKS